MDHREEVSLISSTDPTDLCDRSFSAALVNVTNRCNLTCAHCFVFRDGNPNASIDNMNNATMLHQLEVLRDRHGIKTMLFMGGDPMVRRELVLKGMELFEDGSIVMLQKAAAKANATRGWHARPYGGVVGCSPDIT